MTWKKQESPIELVSEWSLHTWLSIETSGFIPNTKEIDDDMLRKRGKTSRHSDDDFPPGSHKQFRSKIGLTVF